MECPKCQHDNREGAEYCGGCGSPLRAPCAKCGNANPPNNKFCDTCGHNLSQPVAPTEDRPPPQPIPTSTPTGERRQATVLFSDLSGYTAMNEKLDPEEVEGIMSRIKAEAVRIVESHGGIVSQFVGDEVLALFGIPTAHEDDPRRAVRAALELHELARTMSPEVEEKIGRPLRMHTGVNTGLIVTNLRDDRDGRVGVTGDTVNTGARLKALAGEDEVWVSPETHHLISAFFQSEALAPVEMKGKAEPVAPHRVIGATGVRTKLEAAQKRGFTPHMGRERELSTLRRALDRTMAGQGQFITVVGEAGLGKSRLLYEFRQQLDREQVTVLEGRCQSYGEATPYLPWLDALRRGLRLSDEDSPVQRLETAIKNIRAIDAGLEQYIPHYLHLLSIPCEAHPLPADLKGAELKRVFEEALAAIVTLNTRHKAMVYIMEDWHWADDASESALRRLLGLIASYPLMVVVLYRPEYEPRWGNPDYHTPLVLSALDSQPTESMVKSIFGATSLPEALSSLIYGRTDGNPFFIEELCSAIAEEGTVRVVDGRAELSGSTEDLRLPDTVQAVIRSRLDRLNEDAQEALRLASVIGREFARRILEQIHSARARLASTLEDLKTLELIQQTRVLPDAAYMFKHVITQQVTYETLLLQQRKTLHRLVGQAIETLYADRLEEHYETLAHHAYQGGDWEKALAFSRQAGEKAAARSAHQEAIGNFTKGLEVIQHLPEGPEMTQQEITLQLALGVQLMTTKGYGSSEAGRAFTRAMELCRHLKDTPQIFPALWGLARNFLIQSRIQESYEVGEQLLTIAQKLEDPERLLQAHFVQAGTNFWLGNMKLARCHSEQGLTFYHPEDHRKLMDRIGHNLGEACLSYFGQALWFLGYPDQGLEKINQAIASAEAFSHPFSIARALYFSARLHNYRREREMVKMRTQALLLLADEYGFGLWRACGRFMYGWALAAEGSVDEGIGLIHEGISLTEETGNPGRCYALALLAEAYEQSGQTEKGLNALNEAARVIEATGERNWEAEVCRLKGESLLRHGEAESEAEACFRQALAIAHRQEAKSIELRATMSLGRLWRRQGKEKEGRTLLKGVYDWFTEGFDTVELQEAKALIDELA